MDPDTKKKIIIGASIGAARKIAYIVCSHRRHFHKEQN